jgi:hypothetical protein
MHMASAAWKVAKHGPLVELAPGLFSVEAELKGLPVGRRMTLMQLSDGSLAAHSVVSCDESTMEAIEALGPLRFIVVPSSAHRLDAPAWKVRYPSAKVIAPERAVARVSAVVPVDGDYSLLPNDGALSSEIVEGAEGEGVFVHRDAAGKVSLVFNDVFMNLPDKLPGFKGFLLGVLGSTGGPKVTGIAKTFVVRDKARCAAHLRRLSELEGLTQIVPGHGAVVAHDASRTLRAVADRLSA